MNGTIDNKIQQKKKKTIFCHFSFKRPKGKEYGIFAVAFYSDFDGKQFICNKVRKFKLWKNHQFVTAIQSYEHALLTIYELQGQMREANIGHVMLVTDNSTLAGWIENPKKNKKYTAYMNRAVENYRAGATKEIYLSIGLCEVRDYEKSYKFCKEEKVVNNEKSIVAVGNKRVIDLDTSNIKYNTITQLESENPNKPEIIGMEQI